MIKTLIRGVSYVEGDDSSFPSPKIGIVIGSEKALLVDVSNATSRLEEALGFLKDKGVRNYDVALTHFHDDHIKNVSLLDSDIKIYCSKNTSRYLERPNEIVKEDFELDLGGTVADLVLVPSLHSKGSLAVLADRYFFIGDALYSHEKDGIPYFNAQVVYEEKKKLESLSFDYLINAHEGPIMTKEEVLALLENELKQQRVIY